MPQGVPGVLGPRSPPPGSSATTATVRLLLEVLLGFLDAPVHPNPRPTKKLSTLGHLACVSWVSIHSLVSGQPVSGSRG